MSGGAISSRGKAGRGNGSGECPKCCSVALVGARKSKVLSDSTHRVRRRQRHLSVASSSTCARFHGLQNIVSRPSSNHKMAATSTPPKPRQMNVVESFFLGGLAACIAVRSRLFLILCLLSLLSVFTGHFLQSCGSHEDPHAIAG